MPDDDAADELWRAHADAQADAAAARERAWNRTRPLRASVARLPLARMLANLDRDERAGGERVLRRSFSDRARWRLR